MTLIFPVFDRVDLLPRFLKYYSWLGVTRFACALFHGDQNPLSNQIRAVGRPYSLVIRPSTMVSVADYWSVPEVAGLNNIRQEFVRPDEWFAIADLDEFIVPRGVVSLPARAAEAARLGFIGVHGLFLDRLGPGGSYPAVDPKRSLNQLFPFGSRWSKGSGCRLDKVVMQRGDVEIMPGHHYVRREPVWMDAVEVHHFKWTAGIVGRMAERAAAFKAIGNPWYVESLNSIERLKSGSADLTNTPTWPARLPYDV